MQGIVSDRCQRRENRSTVDPAGFKMPCLGLTSFRDFLGKTGHVQDSMLSPAKPTPPF
jgi:hypothetical protein